MRNKNLHLFFKSFGILLVTLYLFHISFKPFPYFFRTRLILTIIAIFFLLRKRKFVINLNVLKVVLWICASLLPIVLTSLINLYFETWFIQNMVLTLIFLLSSYGIVKLMYSWHGDQFSVNDLLKYIIWSVFVHNLIATLGFVIPSFGNLLNNIQNQDENSLIVINSIVEFQSRFIGLGIGSFFTGGVITSLGLLCTSVLIVSEKNKSKALRYILIFMFISLTGMFIARTTLIGLLLSFAFIFSPFFKLTFTKLSFIKNIRNRSLLIISFLTMTMIPILYIGINQLIESSAFVHAFELFLSSNGESSSTNEMMKMYIFPKELKTWFIGDGQFMDGSGYYMGTDIGYLRLIYYYGILGACLFLGQQLYCIYLVRKLSNDVIISKLFFFLAIFILIINFKGIGDISYFLYLFLWFYILKDSRTSGIKLHS